MRIIALSAPILPSRPEALPFERVEIQCTDHAQGAVQVNELFHVPPALLRNGEGWAIEEFTKLGIHSVTHVDAPWHARHGPVSRKDFFPS
jgi:kynurenine formamidase